jgi:predicted DNA-binding protein (UPF0251 family)
MMTAWRLVDREGLSFRQAADVLGVKRGTIQDRVRSVREWYALVGR